MKTTFQAKRASNSLILFSLERSAKISKLKLEEKGGHNLKYCFCLQSFSFLLFPTESVLNLN